MREVGNEGMNLEIAVKEAARDGLKGSFPHALITSKYFIDLQIQGLIRDSSLSYLQRSVSIARPSRSDHPYPTITSWKELCF